MFAAGIERQPQGGLRRVRAGALLIASAQGIHFSVPDRTRLDRASRRLLERFL